VTVALAAALLAGCSTASAHSSAAATLASTRAAALTKSIQRVMRQAAIPGAIVGVWQRGMDQYVRVFGVSSQSPRQPMSTAMYMRIGSETKTFTITALLQLVDRGKVGLDDPIARYVPGVPDGNAITLRELAEMRSGLYSYPEDSAWEKAFSDNPYRQWAPKQLLRYSFGHPLLSGPVPGTTTPTRTLFSWGW
jgi:D-alanyl-D-alanine carboxypeptidase